MALVNVSRTPQVVGGGSSTPAGANTPDVADLVGYYDNTLSYVKGDLVTLRPAIGSEWPGLYQAIADSKNKLPTDSACWRVVIPAGPNLLLQQDTLNPAFAALTAPGVAEAATITIQDVESNSALSTFTVPSGKSYRIEVSEPRPTGRGSSMPSDTVVKLYIRPVESLNADGSTTVTLHPFWHYSAVGTAAAVAAIAAGFLTCRVRVIEL